MSSRLVAIPLLVATLIVILIILWSPPLTLGTMNGFYFNMTLDKQRELSQRLGVTGEELVFYCFIREGCPYCAQQLRFFDTVYPESYMKCDIILDEGCLENLIFFLNESKLINVVSGVPLTLVFKNGYLVAVIEGLNDDADFWNKVTSADPTDKVPLLTGRDKPILIRCFQLAGDEVCIQDEELNRVKLTLSIIVLALGISLTTTLHVIVRNTSIRKSTRKH